MGASGWFYWIPYQPDIEQALQELRLQVKRDSDFTRDFKHIIDEVESFDLDLPEILPDWLDVYEIWRHIELPPRKSFFVVSLEDMLHENPDIGESPVGTSNPQIISADQRGYPGSLRSG